MMNESLLEVLKRAAEHRPCLYCLHKDGHGIGCSLMEWVGLLENDHIIGLDVDDVLVVLANENQRLQGQVYPTLEDE